MKWFKNISKDNLLYGGLIITFIILYGATAFVSWYHAITFFNIANAVWLSVILSFVAEIGQASALFSILLTKNAHKFLTWSVMIILTTLQVIGNVVSSYQWIIDHNSAGVESFQKSILFWMTAADPEIFKVVIAWISGALLPIIALSMTALVAQNMILRAEEAKTKFDHDEPNEPTEPTPEPIPADIIVSEVSKIRLSDEELNRLGELLKNKKPIEKVPIEEPSIEEKKTSHQKFLDDLSAKNESEVIDPNDFQFESPGVYAVEKEINKIPSIEEILSDLSPEAKKYMKEKLDEEIPPTEQLSNEEVIPHYSDEELNEMFMDEYENKESYSNDLDEDAEMLTPDVNNSVEIIPEIVVSNKNGLFEGIGLTASPEPPKLEEPKPEVIVPPDPPKLEEPKPEVTEEQLERIRQIARDNLKKK